MRGRVAGAGEIGPVPVQRIRVAPARARERQAAKERDVEYGDAGSHPAAARRAGGRSQPRGARADAARVEKALKFLTSGYNTDIDEILNDALFTVDYSEMVIVKDIDFYSLCEHHLLPFFGKCHVAYIPRRQVIGLSKIPRLVDVFARRLQIQERMTNQIAETIREKIDPLGVAVVCEGDASVHVDARRARSRTRLPSPARCWARSATTRERAWSFSS